MFRIAELVTAGPVELRWIAGCDHSVRSDSTEPVELSWVEFGRALWSELKEPPTLFTEDSGVTRFEVNKASQRPLDRMTIINRLNKQKLRLTDDVIAGLRPAAATDERDGHAHRQRIPQPHHCCVNYVIVTSCPLHQHTPHWRHLASSRTTLYKHVL